MIISNRWTFLIIIIVDGDDGDGDDDVGWHNIFQW